MNEAHKQCSLLDSIFNYTFYLGPPGTYLFLSPQITIYVWAHALVRSGTRGSWRRSYQYSKGAWSRCLGECQGQRTEGKGHCYNADCCLSQDVREQVFGRFPWIFIFYTINEIHKQYNLLDTIFNYIFYFGPPGKHLYLSPQNPLHVGRRSRPTCSRFSYVFIDVSWKSKIRDIIKCCIY